MNQAASSFPDLVGGGGGGGGGNSKLSGPNSTEFQSKLRSEILKYFWE